MPGRYSTSPARLDKAEQREGGEGDGRACQLFNWLVRAYPRLSNELWATILADCWNLDLLLRVLKGLWNAYTQTKTRQQYIMFRSSTTAVKKHSKEYIKAMVHTHRTLHPESAEALYPLNIFLEQVPNFRIILKASWRTRVILCKCCACVMESAEPIFSFAFGSLLFTKSSNFEWFRIEGT